MPPFLFALALGASFQARCPEQPVISVPYGRGILIDGHLGPAEWVDACALDISPSYRLLVKRDSAYLYLAIARTTPAVFGVNLYVAASDTGAYLNLHASAKLGERVGRPGTRPDWHDWWNNRGWSANVGRFNAFTGERFLPDANKEFQIALARLPGSTLLLSFDVEHAEGTEQPLRRRRPQDGLRWLSLSLAPQR